MLEVEIANGTQGTAPSAEELGALRANARCIAVELEVAQNKLLVLHASSFDVTHFYVPHESALQVL